MRIILVVLVLSALVVISAGATSASHQFEPLVEQQFRDGQLYAIDAVNGGGNGVAGTVLVGNGTNCGADCVYNDSQCAWDVDDQGQGSTVACLLADWAGTSHRYDFWLHLKGRGTACLTARLDPPGWSHQWCTTTTTGKEVSVWMGCLKGPQYDQFRNQTGFPYVRTVTGIRGREGYSVPTNLELDVVANIEARATYRLRWDLEPNPCDDNVIGGGVTYPIIYWEP